MHEVRIINQMSPNPEIASAYIPFWRSGQRSRYSDMLRAGGLADRISGGGRRDFPYTSRQGPKPTQPAVKWVLSLSQG